jgi:hypothetical protein
MITNTIKAGILSLMLLGVNLPSKALSQSSDVNFQICTTFPNWSRPSRQQQRQKLQSLSARYEQQTIKELGGDIWEYNIISFTSYGGSMFFDYNYLSGLWSVKKATPWQCGNNYALDINEGRTARIWLKYYRIVRIKWDGENYIMTVKSANKGVQVIHLKRTEMNELLPLKAVTETGEEIPVLAQ